MDQPEHICANCGDRYSKRKVQPKSVFDFGHCDVCFQKTMVTKAGNYQDLKESWKSHKVPSEFAEYLQSFEPEKNEMPRGFKTCKKCLETKSHADFYSKSSGDGYQTMCKECMKEIDRAQRAKNRAKREYDAKAKT